MPNEQLSKSKQDMAFDDRGTLDLQTRIDRLRGEFVQAHSAGQQPQIEDFLGRIPEEARRWLLRELVTKEVELQQDAGQNLEPQIYFARFPRDQEAVSEALERRKESAESTAHNDRPGQESVAEQGPGKTEPGPWANRVGRYQVLRPLGRGGFGVVYLGSDPELRRDVALKMPRRDRFASDADLERFVEEARTAARLNHPGIVSIFDILRDDGTVCIVQEYVDGQDLAKWLEAQPKLLDPDRVAHLVAEIADAVSYAHQHDFVHRDLKPANVLLDAAGRPRVADFGLAFNVNARHVGEGVGTPAYMSPEQVRGESHRLDGRTDIWSLGVILYEMLTGDRPFHGETHAELFRQILESNPTPLRQLRPRLPAELQRICLKCLSKRMTDRYTRAADLAEDLRCWQDVVPERAVATEPASSASASVLESSTPVSVIPKGLRAFDAGDAEFFLQLLPGPRDRDGLPESVRFWKSRLEATDPSQAFSVGLLYGPSGCGKSSLVKAGLLPHLAPQVVTVYVETTADDTESRLFRSLRRRLPNVPDGMSLVEVVSRLREGEWLPRDQKFVIVLDQFEQWLHARGSQLNGPLVDALRQCDGGRVQCLIMLRDDFWMAATRFMRELEVRLIEGRNSAAVDLFDEDHARKVLAAFGRAFGKLPASSDETQDQRTFLADSVGSLAQDGKVISVRLALFAEMMKARPWTPQTLREVGGAKGVGATFLEETFSASAAPPEHRLHQKAARAVLKALLPESGAGIKGHMRSEAELQASSGYANRPRDFDDLIRILDGETRLITPTETADDSVSLPADSQPRPAPRHYQLTHDYLVPSLREWLTRKQRETRQGRAELRLAERAAIWNAKPENRHLPTWAEWLKIRTFTQRRDWTTAQRAMMDKATRVHLARGAVFGVLLVALIFAGLMVRTRVLEHQASELTKRLIAAETSQAPAIVTEMKGYRRWTDPLLSAEFRAAADGSRQKLNAATALLPVDNGKIEYLFERLLDARADELTFIRDALTPHRSALVTRLWEIAERKGNDRTGQRLRAACALAAFDPSSTRWTAIAPAVADDFARVPAVHVSLWMQSLKRVGPKLLEPLAAIQHDRQRRDTERDLATEILADFAAAQPAFLAERIMEANPNQAIVLLPKLAATGNQGIERLAEEVSKSFPPPGDDVTESYKEESGKRQAMAAAVLLKLGQSEPVWKLFKWQEDPRVRSYLLSLVGPLGVDPHLFISRLDAESDVSALRALILALGEFGEEALPATARDALLPKFVDLYQNHPDPGIHGAIAWLLRHWGHTTQLDKIDRTLASDKPVGQNKWYVNGQGQTLSIIDGSAEFLMGSPTVEEGREGGPEGTFEFLHKRQIGRTFAMASTEVTIEQFQWFQNEQPDQHAVTPSTGCPVNEVTWYDAAEYCNWLSKQEQIPSEQWCYEPNKEGKFASGMKLKPKYLSLSGYRLPSEAEWEFACRAGAVTARYFGETDELLTNYACSSLSSGKAMHPVGSLRPNDLGLFDMLGNVNEWTLDVHIDFSRSKLTDDHERLPFLQVIDTAPRVARGGSFTSNSALVRAAKRHVASPTLRPLSMGFRVTRTCP